MRKKAHENSIFLLALCLCAFVPPSCGASFVLAAPWRGLCVSPSEFDIGFLASRDTDLEGNARLRLLGPFFESQQSDDGKSFVAVRPFFSSVEDPAHEYSLSEFLWPIGMIKKSCGATYWRFLLAFGHDFENTGADSRFRTIVFPILFAGRDKNQEKYFAVFPIGGKINEFLGRDRITFALFPLYTFSSVNDVATHDILWPLISRTTRLRSGSYGGQARLLPTKEGGQARLLPTKEGGQDGEDIYRFRIFPFYGKSMKKGQWIKKFIFWPIWTSAQYDFPGSSGGGFILFPLFGHVSLSDQKSWMVLPPLFRWSRGEKLMELNCPWPLIQYSSGEVDKFYIWPLCGTKSSGGTRTSFFLWPIVSSQKIMRGDYVCKRFTILPVVFYESRVRQGSGFPPEADPPSEDRVPASADTTLRSSSLRSTRASAGRQGSGLGEQSLDSERLLDAGTPNREPRTGNEERPTASARQFKLWPFFSYRREDDVARVRLLDLWPARHTSSIEKNIAPFWTLYSHVRMGEAKEDELLWGLFRYRRNGAGARRMSLFPLFSIRKSNVNEGLREWSFLLGLAGYKREGLRKTFRLLYFAKWSNGVME